MDDQTRAMIRNLEQQTGKSLADWVAVARGLGVTKHGEMVGALKNKHGLGHGYANLVAHAAREEQPDSAGAGDLVAAQYRTREALRPIYEKLLAEVRKFGPDVEIAPKKAYVSLRRSKQFALLQPSTRDRLDVGINLKGVVPSGRLEAAGSFNSMVSHRVRVGSTGEVDAELIRWLRQAWEAA